MNNDSQKKLFLEAKGISKFFGHVTALDNVDIELYQGEVLALVGDNGAGKSTLVSILSGVLQPDLGSIWVDKQKVIIDNPLKAQKLGIGTVFQDLALVNVRDVAANLFLGSEPTKFGFIVDRKRMIREATDAISSLGINLPSVHTQVSLLSGGQRQGVAVARALLESARATLMDEPTAAISVKQVKEVLQYILKLKEKKISIILISHRMMDVFEVCDRIMVLRRGVKVSDKKLKESSPEEVTGLITGAIDTSF